MNKVLSLIFLLTLLGVQAHAQNDPVLAGMIAKFTDKAEKELKAKYPAVIWKSGRMLNSASDSAIAALLGQL